MKLELDLTSSQKTSLINNSENELGSEDIKKMLRSGINLAKEGNRLEARQMLLNVTEAEPNNETAWLWLASISEYPEELLVFLQNVLKVNPQNERALEWAKQTKSLLSKTFVQRGINAAQNNQKEFAKQCFLQGIVHDSENEMAWLWLASTSESQEEKLSHLHQVLRINPDNETALSSLNAVKGQMSQGLLKKASSAAISGDHETARQTLNAVLKNSPNLEEAWILKAFLATDFYEKVECYEKALEINPNCEAAQAGLASLKLLMPNMPKPAAEEVKSVEEVEETKAEEVKIEEPVKEEVVEELAVEEVLPEPAVQESFSAVQEPVVEFDENFDLEQLVEDPATESVEFSEQANEVVQEQAQPESRAFAEEVLFERQAEEAHIHETQTAVKEDFAEVAAQTAKAQSIFNYEEVISQEETLGEVSQTESALEFDETSNNPTQELEEEFAQNAAASFGLVEETSEEKIETLNTQAVEPTQEVVEEPVSELEDFYTEEVVETSQASQDYTEEKTTPVEQKAEVRITEVYDAQVSKAEIYNSEFYANDGFVLVPQNDPFADHTQETVEFSYSEAVEEAVESGKSAEVVEESQPVQEVFEHQEVEQVAESAQETEYTQEYQEVEEFEQNEQIEQAEEVVQFAENQETEVAEVQESFEMQENLEVQTEFEQLVENQTSEEYSEAQETQFTEQKIEPEVAEQAAEMEFSEAEQVSEPEQYVETPEVEESFEAQAVEETFQSEQIVETESVAAFEETVEIHESEPVEQFSEADVEAVQNEEQNEELHVAPEAQISQCPFCAAENQNQAIVCNSCHAMLSLADLEVLISHQGVQQDLLLQSIEKMEVEKSLREFSFEELTFLAIAHLNAKNLQKGLDYLQEAAVLNPADVILTSKIKFLKAHLEELQANKSGTIGRNRTILVVDDSPTVRKLISGKLEKCGHSVLAAVDGMDALAKINEVIPDLILLDITMPRLDGYQVCKLIRNNEMTKDVPIVMISGKDGFFDKVRGRMAGSSGYITKPFGPDTLMKTIETYLN